MVALWVLVDVPGCTITRQGLPHLRLVPSNSSSMEDIEAIVARPRFIGVSSNGRFSLSSTFAHFGVTSSRRFLEGTTFLVLAIEGKVLIHQSALFGNDFHPTRTLIVRIPCTCSLYPLCTVSVPTSRHAYGTSMWDGRCR